MISAKNLQINSLQHLIINTCLQMQTNATFSMDTNDNTSNTGCISQVNKRHISNSSNSTINPSVPTTQIQIIENKKMFATLNQFQSLVRDEPILNLSNEINLQYIKVEIF